MYSTHMNDMIKSSKLFKKIIQVLDQKEFQGPPEYDANFKLFDDLFNGSF